MIAHLAKSKYMVSEIPSRPAPALGSRDDIDSTRHERRALRPQAATAKSTLETRVRAGSVSKRRILPRKPSLTLPARNVETRKLNVDNALPFFRPETAQE